MGPLTYFSSLNLPMETVMANSRRNDQRILSHACNAASPAPKSHDSKYINFSHLAPVMLKL